MARGPSAHSTQSFVCYLLNMGKTKYGDCIVVECGGKKILIDAGHPGDDKDRDDRPSIPSQLEEIFGHEAPFHFDLLVVTHCHQDHIGCLPKLVAGNIVTCDRALVADESLGFGLEDGGEGDARVRRVGTRIRSLLAALSEEDHSNLRGDDLAEFLADAASLQDNYSQMLRTLDRNADLVRYRQGTASERAEVAGIVSAMGSTGMQLFGPTAEQLLECSKVIQSASGDGADFLGEMSDPAESLPQAYLRIMGSVAADSAPTFNRKIGWAKNCQSIVLAFGDAGERILLPGDMQFAQPGIPKIEASVRALRQDVGARGPYVFAKTPHHTSHNGLDEDLLAELGWPPLLGHSGGFNDPTHPDPDTLDLLKGLRRTHPFDYGRTDHNGRVTVEPKSKDISVEKQRLNDFTPNPGKDDLSQGEVVMTPLTPVQRAATATRNQFVDVVFVRIPYESGSVSVDGRVIRIDRPAGSPAVEPVKPPPGPPPAPPPGPEPKVVDRSGAGAGVLAAKRPLPPLVFVTDPEQLRQNIGEAADQALKIIRDSGQRLVTGPGATLAAATRQALLDGQAKGVVLVGGYDVVPSQRIDVLGPQLRSQIPADVIARDQDGFIVWSDDLYGDREPDGIPELPVSRMPDARLASFLLSMLTGGGPAQAGKFAVRNRERPFAGPIYALIPGAGVLQISDPQRADQQQRLLGSRQNVYFMLHGDYRDGTTFWGEDDNGVTTAVDVGSLPPAGIGVAFAGCCWGALTVSEPAFLAGNKTPTPRMPERSMALSVLKAGATAFVGCTGVHYSPGDAGGFYGGPLHEAFWKEIAGGCSPAQALFNARNTYVLGIPHGGRTALWDQAVERKLYKQFTCLGLGW